MQERVLPIVHWQEWWELREGDYASLSSEDGLLKSNTFPGLWLDAAALVSGETERVLSPLQRGLATDEHAAFVAELRSQMGA